MARTLGRDGVIKVATAAVAEVVSWSLDEAASTVDGTVLGDLWAENDTDIKSWSASVEAKWDTSDTTGQEALVLGATVEVHLLPGGVGTGEIDYNGNAIITGISRTGAQGSHVTASFTMTGTGALVKDTLA